MLSLGLLVVAAGVALGIAQRLALPVAPFAVATGFVLRAIGAPLDSDFVTDGLLLAATFLVFTVGTEIDRRHVHRFRWRATLIALFQFVVVAIIAVPWALYLGLRPWTIVFLVLALVGGSTFVAVEVLRRRQHFFQASGRLATGVSIAQDLLVVTILAAIVSTADPEVSTALSLTTLALLWFLSWIVMKWAAPYMMLRMELDDEERLLFAIAVLFGFAGVAHIAGLPPLAGAFFAGAALSRFPVSGLVRGHVTSFSDFFVVLFFTTIGTMLVIPSRVELVTEVLFIVGLMVLRPALLLPVVRRSGLTLRASLETVMLLSPVGELGLIVALVGMQYGHIGVAQLSAIALVSVVTMTLVPWLSSPRVTRAVAARYPTRAADESPHAGHIILIGYGESGETIVEDLGSDDDLVVVDVDPVVVEQLNERGIFAIRGDISEPRIATMARVPEARAIISTAPNIDDNLGLLRLSRAEGAPVLVRVFSEHDAQAVGALGGQPITEVDVAHDAFLSWYRASKSGQAADAVQDDGGSQE